jgi:uncharacterized protein (TIGR02118 family)
MVKLVLLVRRKIGTDRAAFQRYYEATHAPLAGSVMQRCTRYVRNFVAEELTGPMNFDVITEFCFEVDGPWAEAHQGLVDLATRQVLEQDEARFMDRDSMQVFTVTECVSDITTLQGNKLALAKL